MDYIKRVLNIGDARRSFNRVSTKTLSEHGREHIIKATVMRFPINNAVHTLLDLVTLGQWQKVASVHFDKIFHLGLLVETDAGTQIFMEKGDQVIIRTDFEYGESGELLGVNLDGTEISVDNFLKNTIDTIGKEDFFIYDAFGGRNCQTFCEALLSCNGLLTRDLHDFIFQDMAQLVNELPSYMPSLAKKVTDLASIANVIRGKGKNGHVLHKQFACYCKKKKIKKEYGKHFKEFMKTKNK